MTEIPGRSPSGFFQRVLRKRPPTTCEPFETCLSEPEDAALKNKLRAVQEQSKMLTRRLTEQTRATATAIKIQELVVGIAARNGWRKAAVVVEDYDLGQVYNQVALPVGPVEVDFFGGEAAAVKEGSFDVVFLVFRKQDHSEIEEADLKRHQLIKTRLEESLGLPVIPLENDDLSQSVKSAA